MSKQATWTKVETPSYKRFGKVFPAQATRWEVQIVPGKSIKVRDTEYGVEREYKVGDQAEYDSYNLNYLGEITKITNKTVTIVKWGETHRLNLYTFSWRNCSTRNVDEKIEANHETMMYI